MSSHPAPPSTPDPNAGKFPVWVGPRELLYGVFFLAGGGVVGGGVSAVTRPDLPPDVKMSVDAAKNAADDVKRSLDEIKLSLTRLEGKTSGSEKDLDKLEKRVDRAEAQIQELQRKAPR